MSLDDVKAFPGWRVRALWKLWWADDPDDKISQASVYQEKEQNILTYIFLL